MANTQQCYCPWFAYVRAILQMQLRFMNWMDGVRFYLPCPRSFCPFAIMRIQLRRLVAVLKTEKPYEVCYPGKADVPTEKT